MRIFSFIFSFYLLFLSVQPCQDIAASGELFYSKTGSEQACLDDCENKQEEDHECSPFCICSCRQMSVKYDFSITSEAKEITVFTRASQTVSIQNDYSDQYLNCIWQPPKFNFTA